MEEAVKTYVAHIRKAQPHGPYAVAGYSLGSTLAFEVGKLLEAQGQEVRFLASIDYPPHISQYVSGQNWFDVLLHISFFLELIDQETMDCATTYLHTHTISRKDALEYVLSISDRERVRALALTPRLLNKISDIGENFRLQGETYEPVGNVEHLDVFVADPPRYAAVDRRDWVENKLGGWKDFVRSDIEFYECPGIHARMLNPEVVPGFMKSFTLAMKRRGV
jgi:thioesterase domain-containing protein